MKTKEFNKELEKVLSIFDYSFIYYYFGKKTPQFNRCEHFAIVHYINEFGNDRYGIFMNDSNDQTNELRVIPCKDYKQAKEYLQKIII